MSKLFIYKLVLEKRQEMLVIASDERDAVNVAKEFADEQDSYNPQKWTQGEGAIKITREEDIPNEWEGGSPWHDGTHLEDDIECIEFLRKYPKGLDEEKARKRLEESSCPVCKNPLVEHMSMEEYVCTSCSLHVSTLDYNQYCKI